jgi:hypothetical protein
MPVQRPRIKGFFGRNQVFIRILHEKYVFFNCRIKCLLTDSFFTHIYMYTLIHQTNERTFYVNSGFCPL